MPASPTKKGASKVRHLGRSKSKIERYYASIYPKRKLRHILLNNGVAAAKAWADKYTAQSFLPAVAKKLGINL